MGEHFDALTDEQKAAVSHHAEKRIQEQMEGRMFGEDTLDSQVAATYAKYHQDDLREHLREDLAQHGNLDQLLADYADYRETLNSKYKIPPNRMITLSEVNDIISKKDPGGRTR